MENRHCLRKKFWFCFLLFLYFFVSVNFVVSLKIDESQLSQGITKLKLELDSHIDRVLAYDQIQQMLDNAEKSLLHGPINGTEVFHNVFEKVSLRYNDVVLSANILKASIEKEANLLNGGGFGSTAGVPPRPGGGGPPPQIPPTALNKCCCQSGPGDFYGRVRDRVYGKQECYGSEDALLRALSKTEVIKTLKDNYDKYPAIAWQYFADSDGHYIQYPANNRACDKPTSPLEPVSCASLNSPLTEEWFVEKLHMERKNLVILMDNSNKADPNVPPGAQTVLVDAVENILNTLTPNDKVNVVISPSSAGHVQAAPRCGNSLFVADPANLNYLKDYTRKLSQVPGEPDLLEGLKNVYELLKAEQQENPISFGSKTNLVLIILHGSSKPLPTDIVPLFEMIAQSQIGLNKSVQNFIYTLGTADPGDLEGLAQVADQNNMKLEKSSGTQVKSWPLIPSLVTDQPIGPEGILHVVNSSSDFARVVGTYFQRLPPQTDKELTTVVPVLDKKYGVGMTVAVPVYNMSGSQGVGVVAVDASLATVFSEIINFDLGENSYMYVVENMHGHVLLHPKLREPGDTNDNTIFPRLELIEPDLTEDNRRAILSASTRSVTTFEAKLADIDPEVDGELVTRRDARKSPAVVYFRQIPGTRLVIVLVLFRSDVQEPKFVKPNQVPLHGIYHRLDYVTGAPGSIGSDSVCHLDNGHFLSFKQSVIKFAPDVFTEPEVYKYSLESPNDAANLNMFVTKGTSTNLINHDIENEIWHTLEASDQLDSLWTSSSREVIERFYGSQNGVFRIYPGFPMLNTFDHRKTDWYKRSVAFPNTTLYHYGKLSVINRNNVIIVSRAVQSSYELNRTYGVVGMTVTPRFLTSQLMKTMVDCSSDDKQCHILDTTGMVVDSLHPTLDRHISKLYHWLTSKLVTSGKLKQEWCTGFSDGYHKMTFTLTEDVTFDLLNGDPCLQFSLHNVKDTNLFVLVLGDRDKLKCNDKQFELCTSCDKATYNPTYQLTLPRCSQCLSNVSQSACQCPCYCDNDLDACHGQFNTKLENFPTVSCFYPPESFMEFKPDPPGPMQGLERCPIPCVAIEDLDICNDLAHCKVSTDTYPVCIWKNEEELKNVNVSRFFPTPSHPPLPMTSHGGPPSLIPHGTTPTNPGQLPPSKGSTSQQKPNVPTGLYSSTTVKSPPGFVISTKSSVVTPPLSGSPIHPVTGSATKIPGHQSTLTGFSQSASTQGAQSTTVSNGATSALGKSSEDNGPALSGGAIAALVIGLLAFTTILVYAGIKIYKKKFRHLGTEDSSKYRAGSTMFDSTLFLRNADQVSINASAPSSTAVPYQEMNNS